jgi:anti-sigma B factor antagonist
MVTPEPFSVRTVRERGAARLVPTGELDLATVSDLEAAFDEAFSDGTVEMIVVDLTELDFMDSTGINVLMRMNEACRHVDRLRIINGSPAAVRVLDLAGVRSQLPIISSDDDPFAPPPPNGGRRRT